MDKPNCKIPTVNDIQVIEGSGPWNTKSGGKLNVLFSLPDEITQGQYFNYETSELERLPRDIRGLRVYSVSNLVKESVGANEWHRVRNELVFAFDGSVQWLCEDLYGEKREFVLDGSTGIWTPPFILHTYVANSEKCELLVIANTLFFPEEPDTHDSYSLESFRKLQASYRK